jgi:trehalose 6-phosphate phosphatase
LTLGASREARARIDAAERLWLFLDYDGTLADFAPTPEHVIPRREVINLLAELAEQHAIRVTVISGRRLGHIEELVPVSEVLLAGTYGVELRLPGDGRVDRVAYDAVRPVLEVVKPGWERLIADRDGFFLEDKGWALAIHARFAADAEAEEILGKARRLVVASSGEAISSDLFRVLGGHKFLEVAPALAHKGRTVAYLLDRCRWPGALPLYVGDDDKDEEAFGVIQARGGVAIRVCEMRCDTRADGRLESPQDVRRWLRNLLASRSRSHAAPPQP